MDKFSFYGVLWNKNFDFAKDLISDIDKTYHVESLIEVDVRDNLYRFIKDAYHPLLPDDYAKYKAKMLEERGCGDILVFKITVDNPEFLFDYEEQHKFCVQTKMLKNAIREKYIPMMDNYVLDVLVHFSDCGAENKFLLNAVRNNRDRIKEVRTIKENGQERCFNKGSDGVCK